MGSHSCVIAVGSRKVCEPEGAYQTQPIYQIYQPTIPSLSRAALQVLSSEVLENGGMFLLENGFEALLYIDKGASPQLLQVRVWSCY